MLKPIGEVIKAVQAEDSMQVDFDPSFFILSLNNDSAGPVNVDLANVYVEGKPMVPENATPVTLERRGSVEIRFSDVASSYVEAGNSYFFASFGPKA
jgi:hypothetical protein